MAKQIKAPTFPESVPDGTIATWYKKEGEEVSRDELLVDIETDKVLLEVVAPDDGVLKKIHKGEGDTVNSGELVAEMEPGAKAESSGDKDDKKSEKKEDDKEQEKDKKDDKDDKDKDDKEGKKESKGADDDKKSQKQDDKEDGKQARKDESRQDGTSASQKAAGKSGDGARDDDEDKSSIEVLMSPAARKLIEENDIDPNNVPSTGKDGRITKEDVVNYLGSGKGEADKDTKGEGEEAAAQAALLSESRSEKRVPMTRLRAKVAERLLQATQTTAMLTTFNEVDMSAVMELREKYKDLFEKKHEGTRLGFMSFFVRASVEALKRFPAVNASIDGSDIIYHGYQDIGVAVSSPRGLVVPVLRDADSMSFAQIEKAIRDYGVKAKDGKLSIEEMSGGTFTISNGGVFGSLLSTPILNPPQTAILGMHKIQERPMAVDGEVVVRPMMYLALSYDHRMIDGKEAVQFLVTIKELLEEPARIFLEV